MNNKLLLGLLLLLPVRAMAAAVYLGTANQDVTVTAPLPTGANTIGNVGVTSLPSIPAGANAIGTVGVTSLPSIPTGSNNIGTVSGSTVTSVIKDGSGNAVTVTNNKLDTNADVSASTVGIKGSQGTVITSQTKAAGTALLVNNAGRPDLDGLSLVYKSSDAMIVGGALTLTGKANSVDLQAVGNDCTFNINGGDAINVGKNTAEAFAFDYHATNLTVNLTAKGAAATCRVRITGAN